MQRIFAHKIIYQGRQYRNHIAELTPSGTIRLTPFTGETPSTTFISGTIRLHLIPGTPAPSLTIEKLP